MKLPLSWLKEFVTISLPPTTLAERLAMHGLEVEAIIDRRHDFDHVVVGAIVAINPHPNADKLRLADVIFAVGGKPQTIVCGAPNIAVGQKVPVALLGAKLPNGMRIASRPIRGVVSEGMLCAEDELGLGHSHSGIVLLDPGTPLGVPFASVLGYDDVILDLAIPANRPDLMSVRGLAWEIAAILGVTFREPKRPRLAILKSTKKPWTVAVADKRLCPLYTARVIRDVTITASPLWLQQRLTAVGVRPINAVVDATNYIMLEYGQPLHAFDAGKIHGGIKVRAAIPGERLETLDRQARTLKDGMIVVADTNGPIALAGVMGGAMTEISSGTTEIILEAAIFDPVSIRRTSRSLGLVSEASKRFEKGLPVSLPNSASRAAAALIVDLCGGRVEPGATVIGTMKLKPQTIVMSPLYPTELLGQPIAPVKVKHILQGLGFTCKGTIKKWTITVPSWRLDVTRPEDLVDEIGRMIGYDVLPDSLPLIDVVPHDIPRLVRLKDELRDCLVGFGFTEVITHAYYGEQWKKTIGGDHVEIANPIDKSQQYLRRSLVPQMHAILHSEIDAGRDVKIFQIGRVFHGTKTPIENQQPWMLCLAMAWKPEQGYVYSRNMRGYVEGITRALKKYINAPIDVHVDTSAFKNRLVEWCEVPVAAIVDDKKLPPVRVSKYPASTRDISFFWSGKRFGELLLAIRNLPIQIINDIEVIDAFYNQGKTSYAISFTFQAPDRTLTKGEVDLAMEKIITALKQAGATIR